MGNATTSNEGENERDRTHVREIKETARAREHLCVRALARKQEREKKKREIETCELLSLYVCVRVRVGGTIATDFCIR